MGHSDGSIDDHYRERIEDSRLVAVSEWVRGKLLRLVAAAVEGGEK